MLPAVAIVADGLIVPYCEAVGALVDGIEGFLVCENDIALPPVFNVRPTVENSLTHLHTGGPDLWACARPLSWSAAKVTKGVQPGLDRRSHDGFDLH